MSWFVRLGVMAAKNYTFCALTPLTQATYHRGLGLISLTQGTAERFYRYDAQGSVRALSDGTAVTDTYTFDAYGNTTGRTGTSVNAYQYTGEQRDEETGNYYLRARYYNPANSQFISRDSWEGDSRNPITLNKYTYANSNPAMYTDPSGHMGIMEVEVIQAIVEAMSSTSMYVPSGIPSPKETTRFTVTNLPNGSSLRK